MKKVFGVIVRLFGTTVAVIVTSPVMIVSIIAVLILGRDVIGKKYAMKAMYHYVAAQYQQGLNNEKGYKKQLEMGDYYYNML